MRPEIDDDSVEALPVLDLDDTELGIHAEDRYAAIPPGPRLIRRRSRDRSASAPVVLLVMLVALFAVGAFLDGVGGRDGDGAPGAAQPVLEGETGATVLLLGDETARAFDVDTGRPAAARLALRADSLLPSSAPGRFWLVTTTGATSQATERDLAGDVTAEVAADGVVVGALSDGVVVERATRALEVVRVDGSTGPSLGTDRVFLASRGQTVVTRPLDCFETTCALAIDDVSTPSPESTVSATLGRGGAETAALSPDGRYVAVLRSDGLESLGVIVDVRLETVVAFRARAVERDPGAGSALTWSADGAWLFVATERGVDAVDSLGQVYRVEGLPEFDGFVPT